MKATLLGYGEGSDAMVHREQAPDGHSREDASLIVKAHLGQRAYACDRDLVEVMTSSPSLLIRFFSCAGQHLQLRCAVWEVLGDAKHLHHDGLDT